MIDPHDEVALEMIHGLESECDAMLTAEQRQRIMTEVGEILRDRWMIALAESRDLILKAAGKR